MTGKGNERRRKESKEFKVNAIELMMRSNKLIIETAASLGIRTDLLRRWEKEYSALVLLYACKRKVISAVGQGELA